MSQGIRKLTDDVAKSLKSSASIDCITTALRLLLQNSIDAGASHITVFLDLPNRVFTVADNGLGMTRRDLTCFGQQNYTSKLTDVQDVDHLKTYGFKGCSTFEISNVAKISVISKHESASSGWMKELGGRSEDINNPITEIEKLEKGTVVTVDDFFHNLPVRLESLERSTSGELLDRVRFDIFEILVVHPEVEICINTEGACAGHSKFLETRGIKRSLPETEKLLLCLQDVFGLEGENSTLKPVHAQFTDYVVDGLISEVPTFHKKIQLLYVNGLKCEDSALLRPISRAFRNARNCWNQTHGRSGYEMHVLKISMPRCKTKILGGERSLGLGTKQYQIIHALIFKIIESVFNVRLNQYTAIAHRPSKFNTSCTAWKRSNYSLRSASGFEEGKIPALKKPKPEPPEHSWNLKSTSTDIDFKKLIQNAGCRGSSEASQEPIMSPFSTLREHFVDRSLFKRFRVVNQVDKKFVLLKSYGSNPDILSLVLLDQHAADERIKYESLLNGFIWGMLTSPHLHIRKAHIEVDLSPKEYHIFQQCKNELHQWGILFEGKPVAKSRHLVKLTALPDPLQHRSIEALKNGIIQHACDLRHLRKNHFRSQSTQKLESGAAQNFAWWNYLNSIPTMITDSLKSKACRSAIMFGDYLSPQETTLLVEMLGKCRNPFYCAHGRPSLVPIFTHNGCSHTNFTEVPAFADYRLT